MAKTDEDTNAGAGKPDARTPSATSDASAKPAGVSGETNPGAQSAGGAEKTSGGGDAVSMLKQDHRAVEALFAEFEKADEPRKGEIIKQACQALVVHSTIEERIFYPAVEELDEDKVEESLVEHDCAKVLILDLADGDPGDPYREAKFKVLAEQVRHHIKEEEAPDGVMAKAQKAGLNTRELGRRLAGLKQQLEQQMQEGRLPEPEPKTLEHFARGRAAGRRGRGEGGRFASDERRNPAGRFNEDRDRGRSDDDRGYRSGEGGRGHGGWYGDPQGHSQASRRGWDERDDERRSYAASDRDDDDRRQGSRRGHGGWYGDPEGHSEASRRGWDEREGGGSSSRSRRD